MSAGGCGTHLRRQLRLAVSHRALVAGPDQPLLVGWAGGTEVPPRRIAGLAIDLEPVALSRHDVDDYYHGFANRTLWPYGLADVCLVTPRQDGMNLVAKEYVTVHEAIRGTGVLVLSEFAGAGEELRGTPGLLGPVANPTRVAASGRRLDAAAS